MSPVFNPARVSARQTSPRVKSPKSPAGFYSPTYAKGSKIGGAACSCGSARHSGRPVSGPRGSFVAW